MPQLTTIGLTGDVSVLLVAAIIFALLAASTLLVTAPVGETPAARLARYVATPMRPGSPGVRVNTAGPGERLAMPVIQRLAGFIARAAPPKMHQATATRLTMAGSNLSPSAFLAVRTLIFVGLPAIAVLNVTRSGPVTTTGWLILGLSLLLGRKLPDVWLKRRIRARQQAIDRSLPYALDLMVACLEGGLSLDASLAKVAEQSDGPLATEIALTLQEIALGRPASDAMKAMGDRTGAPDLKRFTNSIVQAERMGIAVAEAMRTLSHESRVRRRQRAEEMARKAPIKMVPVLIFFVLPSLMVVILAPAALILVKMFSEQAR